MAKRIIETILPINADRTLPPSELAKLAQAIKASGAVDHFHIWDQLMGWWPLNLWTPENAPIAAFVPDLDSTGDAAAVAAYAAASAPGMGLTISPDAIRHGPAEMMQRMLTLANMGDGRAILQLGAGEVKQTQPFGWKRNEGLRRVEDHFRFYDAFWKGDGTVTMNGNFWNFEQAYIGQARQHRPRMWALGGGPKLMDIATSYADGFATAVPNVMPTPEVFGNFVKTTKEALEKKGRDPEAFDFCPWIIALVHDDPETIQRALKNPVLLWFIAGLGRFHSGDWAQYGVEGAFPSDWHYATKLIPNRYPDKAEVDAIISRVNPTMCQNAFIVGNAAEVADQIQAYIDVGATHIDLGDMMPLVLDPADAMAGLGRQFEVLARIKKRNNG